MALVGGGCDDGDSGGYEGGSAPTCTAPAAHGPYAVVAQTRSEDLQLGTAGGTVVDLATDPGGDTFALISRNGTALLLRLGPDGGVDWTLTLDDGAQGFFPFAMAKHGDAMYVAAFEVTLRDETPEGETIEGDLVIQQVHAGGGRGWEQRIPGGTQWTTTDIAVDDGGEVLVGLPRRILGPNEAEPPTLLRLGSGGEVVDEQTFDEETSSFVALASGDAGSVFAAFGANAMRIDADGTVAWSEQFENLRALAPSPTGIMIGTELREPGSLEFDGFALTALDSDGQTQWAAEYAFPEWGRLHSLAVACDGSVAIIGEHREPGESTGDFTSQAFVTHVAPDGETQWTLPLGDAPFATATGSAWHASGALTVGTNHPVNAYDTDGPFRVLQLHPS